MNRLSRVMNWKFIVPLSVLSTKSAASNPFQHPHTALCNNLYPPPLPQCLNAHDQQLWQKPPHIQRSFAAAAVIGTTPCCPHTTTVASFPRRLYVKISSRNILSLTLPSRFFSSIMKTKLGSHQ